MSLRVYLHKIEEWCRFSVMILSDNAMEHVRLSLRELISKMQVHIEKYCVPIAIFMSSKISLIVGYLHDDGRFCLDINFDRRIFHIAL